MDTTSMWLQVVQLSDSWKPSKNQSRGSSIGHWSFPSTTCVSNIKRKPKRMEPRPYQKRPLSTSPGLGHLVSIVQTAKWKMGRLIRESLWPERKDCRKSLFHYPCMRNYSRNHMKIMVILGIKRIINLLSLHMSWPMSSTVMFISAARNKKRTNLTSLNLFHMLQHPLTLL